MAEKVLGERSMVGFLGGWRDGGTEAEEFAGCLAR